MIFKRQLAPSKLDRINFYLCRVNEYKFQISVRSGRSAIFNLLKSRNMYKNVLNWRQFRQLKKFQKIVWD